MKLYLSLTFGMWHGETGPFFSLCKLGEVQSVPYYSVAVEKNNEQKKNPAKAGFSVSIKR